MIKISVIIPSLNVADYIEECILSVINQDMDDVEILCIDAGSTDGTREILGRYAESNENMKVFISQKKSYGYQVNYGIDMAKGKYITVIESDDYAALDMLSQLYNTAEEYNADVVKADYINFLEDDCGEKNFFVNHLFIGKDEYLYNCCLSNESLPVHVYLHDDNLWSAIYKKDFLKEKKIRFNESAGAAYQDIGFLQQIRMLARRIVYIDDMLYYYRTDRVESSSNQPGWLRNIYQEYTFLVDGKISETKEWTLYNKYVSGSIAYLFIMELKRSIISTKFVIENTSWFEYYKKMALIIREFIDKNKITEYIFPDNLWKELLLAVYSVESYRDYLKVDYDYNERRKMNFIRQCQNKSCIIFGCGYRGRKMYDFLNDNRINVAAFWDNDENKWGNKYQGVSIKKPESLSIGNDGYVFVISIRGAEKEIIKQLKELNVNENDIYYFDV